MYVKQLLEKPPTHTGMWVQVPVTLLPIQLSVNVLGNWQMMAQGIGSLCGKPSAVLGS